MGLMTIDSQPTPHPDETKKPGLWERLRALIGKNPREFLNNLANSDLNPEDHEDVGQEVEEFLSHEEVEEIQEFRQLNKGESFDDNPILLDESNTREFYKICTNYYGEVIGEGKWSVVTKLREGDAFKFYKQQDNILSLYDLVFMSRYGGQAGLPEFRGFVPNGYQMEAIDGETLEKKYRRISRSNTEMDEEFRQAMHKLMSPEQAQDLLNKVAEYHRVTGRIHGDLATTKGYENIMITADGEVRIIDTEWERLGDQTPQGELRGLFDLLTNNLGIQGLQLPQTISAEEAEANLAAFKQEVREELIFNSAHTSVIGFKGNSLQVKVEDDGLILVSIPEKKLAD